MLLWLLRLCWDPPVVLRTASRAVSGADAIGTSASVLWNSVLWLRLDDLEAVVSAKPKMREKTPDVGPCHYIQASSPLSDLYTRSLTTPLMASPAAQPGRSEVLDIKSALCP